MDLKNRTELAHIFLLTGLLFGIAAAIYHSYLFGGSVYIFRDVGSDTFNQYWPDIESFFRKIHGGELHAWLFSMGLGNALPVILHYVADPFTLLLVFFPDGTLAFGLIWVAVLKELAAGILMYLFCREIGLRRSSSMLAGILWAFSGYMVLWGQHYFMATALPCYAMVMLGLVLYRHRRSGKLMMLGLWLAAVNSVYTAAWIVIGFLITILVLYLLEEKKSFRRFWIYLWGYFWRGLTAAGLSAVVWLPSILEMLRSSRYQEQGKMGIDFFWSGSDLLDIILRGFSNNSLGINASNALGYNYYEQIMWAASILGIVFVFHNMIVRKGKERLLCIVTGALALISLVSRIPAYLLNFGKYVTYRWSYLIVFVIILNTVYAAEDILKNRKTRRKLLIFDFSFGAALLIVSFQVLFHFYTSEMAAEDLAVSIFVYRGCIVFLLIYFLLFFLVTFLQSEKGVLAAKMMLTCFVCMEAVVLNYPTLNVNRVPVPKAGAYTMDYYSPGNREAIRWVKEFDQDLYRMERTMICGGNDPLIMDYHGTFSYGMHGKEIDEFYERNSLNDPNGDFTSRIAGNETLESLLGVRYMLSVEPLREKGYEELRRISVYNDAISQWDEIYVNQNQYAFPLIYAVNKEDGEMIEKMMGGAYDYEALQRMFPRIAGMEITEFRESMLTGVLDAGDECVLLTSIPYDPGWRIYVDDEKTLVRVVNYGFLGADLQPGQHRISMKFIPQGLDAGLAVTFVTLAVLIAGILIKRKGSKKLWMA